MIELPLTQEAIEYGRDVKLQQDADALGDQFKVPGADKRWTGHAVEHVLDQHLTELGIPHAWNGGLDDKPDFELGGLGLACKANTGPGPYGFFQFVIPKKQITRLSDVALFSIVSPAERVVWVMGTIHSSRFRERAELRRKGEPGFVPGRELYADCWSITASSLDEPEAFFKMMEVASHAA